MGGRVIFAALCGAAALAAPAWGVDTTVELGNDKTISPVNVTVDPGDTVTWEWVGPDTNHSTTSMHSDPFEVWDSNPGPVNNVPDSPVGRTFPHTFNEPGSYFYVCKVHPDDMSGTITVTGTRPTAALMASPTNPLTGDEVTFDASGSSAPVGLTITKHEWDLDGNASTGVGGFETDTGLTPAAAQTYATAGNRTVRLQVTDSAGHHNRSSVAVNVRTRVPTAAFTITPNPAQKGELVTYTSTSTDNDGDTPDHDWDLDGDGTFETPTGTIGTTSLSYAAAGARTIRLRVTDGDGTSTATGSLTVSNVSPTASFTAAPSSVLVGETVEFDGSASSDPPPGTIAGYSWDLDGNGSFETDTGTTQTTSRSYSSAGTVTVRLQVADDDGATATTSRTVTVSAPAQAPPPPPPPPPARQPAPASTPPADTGMPAPITTSLTPRAPVPPLLTLGGSTRQRLAARRPAILITARCDGNCALKATGRLTVKGVRKAFRLRAARATLDEAGRARLRLAVPPSVVKAVKRGLRRRKRVVAAVTVTATGPGGAATVRRAIRLR